MDWRLLIKECIANIGIPLVFFGFFGFNDFLRFEFLLGLIVFASQPTVHNGGVSRGKVCGCGCWPR